MIDPKPKYLCTGCGSAYDSMKDRMDCRVSHWNAHDTMMFKAKVEGLIK